MKNIKTTFALRDLNTGKLFSLNVESDYIHDCGIQVEQKFSIDLHGDLGTWETPDLWAALTVKSFWNNNIFSKNTPELNSRNDVEIVAIHYLNDNVKFISNLNVTQSIFELVKNTSELIDFLSYDQDFNFNTNDNIYLHSQYEKYGDRIIACPLQISKAFSVLEHFNRIPDLTPSADFFKKELNKLINDL